MIAYVALLVILSSTHVFCGISDGCPVCFVGSCDGQKVLGLIQRLEESVLNVEMTAVCSFGTKLKLKLQNDLYPQINPVSYGYDYEGVQYCSERIEVSNEGMPMLILTCKFPFTEMIDSPGLYRSELELNNTKIRVESGIIVGLVETPKYIFGGRRALARGTEYFITDTEYGKVKTKVKKASISSFRSIGEPDYIQEDTIFYPIIFMIQDEGSSKCHIEVLPWVTMALPIPLAYHIYAGEERMEVLFAIITPPFDAVSPLSYENTKFESELSGHFNNFELTQEQAEIAFGYRKWDQLSKFDYVMYSLTYYFPHCYSVDDVYIGLGGFLESLAGYGYIEFEFNSSIPRTCVDIHHINTKIYSECDPNKIHKMEDTVEVTGIVISEQSVELKEIEFLHVALHKTTDNSEVMVLKNSDVITQDGIDLGYDEQATVFENSNTKLSRKITFTLSGTKVELFKAAQESGDSLSIYMKIKAYYDDERREIVTFILTKDLEEEGERESLRKEVAVQSGTGETAGETTYCNINEVEQEVKEDPVPPVPEPEPEPEPTPSPAKLDIVSLVSAIGTAGTVILCVVGIPLLLLVLCAAVACCVVTGVVVLITLCACLTGGCSSVTVLMKKSNKIVDSVVSGSSTCIQKCYVENAGLEYVIKEKEDVDNNNNVELMHFDSLEEQDVFEVSD